MSKCFLSLLRTSAIVVCLIGCATFVQAQAEDRLWQFTAPAIDTSAIVQVELDGAIGTGVIICVDKGTPVGEGYAGFCLTAQHVVEADEGRRAVRVTYGNGKVARRCKVVASDTENDVALLWVWVPEGIRPVPVAKNPVRRNQWVHFSGLGGGKKLNCCRHFKGKTAPPTTDEKIFSPVSLLPGDSGGPVFNDRGEVVGVISGGWLWFTANRPEETSGMQATWPARACNVGAVRKLITDTVVCLAPTQPEKAETAELAVSE